MAWQNSRDHHARSRYPCRDEAGAFKFKLEYRLEDVSEVRAIAGGSKGRIRLVMTDGDKQKFGTAGIRDAKADAVACAAAIERARQHPDGPTVSQALPQLNELGSKIAASKRTVVASPPQGAGHSSSFASGLAAEIAELSALRDAGALTEEEFATAKARLLGR